MVAALSESSPPKKNREKWLDLCKGITLVFVISGHFIFWAKASDSGSLLVRNVEQGMWLMYMPLIMVASGVVLPHLLKKPIRVFVESRVRGVLWPLFVWTFVYILVRIDSLNPSSLAEDFSVGSWFAPTYLWYLKQLFLFSLCALLFKRMPTWLPCLAFFLASIALIEGDWHLYAGGYKTLLFFGVFGSFGYLIGANLDRAMRFFRSPYALIMLPFTAGLFWYSYGDGFRLDKSLWYAYPLTLAGVVGIIVLAIHLQGFRLLSPLVWIGKHSLIFYVVHFNAELLVGRMYSETSLLSFVPAHRFYLLVLFAGFAVPAIFVWLTKFRPVNALFVMPRFAGR
ncbi:acyltransferase family protein [Dermabacteraceae bacterium P7054]